LASLYIHIPFCKQACNYCNFHFSTQLQYAADMINSITLEMKLRKHELPNKPLQSIYVGGGTPSILSDDLLHQLFSAIYNTFKVKPNAEITIEANPDDITVGKLNAIKKTPVNRFSMGVQSFFDEDLKWMNRAHKADEAEKSIKLIQDFGFDKISIDLIYGGPTLSNENWAKNLAKINELGLNHVSAYCLTVEPQTALHSHISKGKLAAIDEEKVAEQFNMMIEQLSIFGFEQYEISNFARSKEYAVHNTSYRQNKPYLGIGPSAHSFNGNRRSWNVANNQVYMKQLAQQILPLEIETLTTANRINEYIMTGLRTIWGCSWHAITSRFGKQYYAELKLKIEPYVNQKQIIDDGTNFKLTTKARILADGIASDLFFENELL
jgi:oxygen-independent coproporphyrinogen-3 oxidase